MTKRIIVGISGASGIVYGVRALEMLAQTGVETHLSLLFRKTSVPIYRNRKRILTHV